MNGIKRRIEKFEASHGIRPLPDFEKMSTEQIDAWFEEATHEELEARIRELGELWKGCSPEEVDLSPENTKAMMAELETKMKEAGEVIICNDQDLS
jgi:hypothetical protein